MRKFKFKSLTMRIWATFTAIILVIILSISLIYLGAYRRISENAKIQDLKVAHDILLNIDNYNAPNRFDELKNLEGSDHFIVKINDNNTKQIIDIGKRQGPPQRPPQGHPTLGDNDIKGSKLWMTSYISDDNIHEKEFKEFYNKKKFIFIISSVNNGSLGNSYLVSYIPDMEDNRLLNMVMGIGFIFILIGLLTAKLVAGYIVRPLKKLEDYTIRIAHKDWKEPIDIKSEDEIGRLANSMNHMRKELKRADDEEKMFLQSISHDLKTPVMVIMSHADAIIDGIYIDSVENTAKIIRDEAISLEKKIKQMLYLNTLDYIMGNTVENVKINLCDLLFHIVNRFELVKSEIEWELDIDKVMIKGNVDKIQVSIENILDNALRYAEKKICVTLKDKDSFGILEIYNDGPNIDNDNINHIFDNFYKDKTGNFGLGLAISKKIINFYDGEIKVINREKGVSFIIKFPNKD